MEKQELSPGFIGISYGDCTFNAIIWGRDEEVYFYPVNQWQAEDLEDFQVAREQTTDKAFLRRELYDILGDDLSDADVLMFINGDQFYLD